jgi:hypothetical protein
VPRSAPSPIAEPSSPVAGSSSPIAVPSQPIPSSSRPVAGSSTPITGPPSWIAGPSRLIAGPSKPIARPSRSIAIATLLAVSACRAPKPSTPPGAEELVAYLATVAGTDAATRRAAVDGWELDRLAWNATIVEPWRTLWDDYHGRFAPAEPALIAQLAHAGTITARRHYAGDPRLTLSQARLRWALPPLYPSFVAELDGQPIDTVFVFDGAAWRALAGLDESVLALVTHVDHECGELLEHAGPRGRCTEMGWGIADAALRGDRSQLAHMCKLATPVCGNRSP